MVPFTAMKHAQGYFSAGTDGFTQAAEFFAGGVALVAILSMTAAWVAHGFAVRNKEGGDETEEPRPPRPATAGTARPTADHPPRR